jgi:hypothetical protein
VFYLIVSGGPSPGVKPLSRKPDHPLSSNAKFKECIKIYRHTSRVLLGVRLKKKWRDNFTFNPYIQFE